MRACQSCTSSHVGCSLVTKAPASKPAAKKEKGEKKPGGKEKAGTEVKRVRKVEVVVPEGDRKRAVGVLTSSDDDTDIVMEEAPRKKTRAGWDVKGKGREREIGGEVRMSEGEFATLEWQIRNVEMQVKAANNALALLTGTLAGLKAKVNKSG